MLHFVHLMVSDGGCGSVDASAATLRKHTAWVFWRDRDVAVKAEHLVAGFSNPEHLLVFAEVALTTK